MQMNSEYQLDQIPNDLYDHHGQVSPSSQRCHDYGIDCYNIDHDASGVIEPIVNTRGFIRAKMEKINGILQ